MIPSIPLKRNQVAAVIFAIVILFLLGVLFFPGAVAWLAPDGTRPFTEDFSNIRNSGWYTRSDVQTVMKLESGGYTIQVNQARWFSFAYPPIEYFPARGAVDVLPVGTYSQSYPGTYGMICRHQASKSGDKYYFVVVDPYLGAYEVHRVEGTYNTPLLRWQPATGLKDAAQVNRIGLSCQDDQLVLTINGTSQPPVSDPAMAQFGDGRLGFFAGTGAVLPEGGFKVLFDNASFWPPN
jgi:hypothetical protein